jgi:hypothetical protein
VCEQHHADGFTRMPVMQHAGSTGQDIQPLVMHRQQPAARHGPDLQPTSLQHVLKPVEKDCPPMEVLKRLVMLNPVAHTKTAPPPMLPHLALGGKLLSAAYKQYRRHHVTQLSDRTQQPFAFLFASVVVIQLEG